MINAGQGIHALCLLLSLTRNVLDEHIVRLGLVTPHERPMRTGGAKAWSVKDTLRLIVWRLAAVHPEIIAQRLDVPRSANAVRAKARRLGIPCPARKALHKPDPASLRDPNVSDLWATIILASAKPGQTVDEALKDLSTKVVGSPAELVQLPIKEIRRVGKQNKSTGQREFSFFGIVRERDEPAPTKPQHLPAPTREDQVDFENPLTWFRGLRGRTKAQTNKVAVWVGFMLTAGGLHYKEAAKLLGVKPGAYRTFKTRVGIPSDSDRRKMGSVFDLEAAEATLARSGYELRRCLKSDNWFWAKKSEKGIRLSPPLRTGEKIIGERGNKFTIVTRAMLEAEKLTKQMPFAKNAASMSA
ncbi:MAG: hypothetical protein KGH75_01285 [Rhodospirillales bacterium]|nr:hypothetical protein [Rhodospirillales bacterium]